MNIDTAACVLNCRRAMEFAVKWMYSVDGELKLPWDDKLVSLLSTDEFRDVVDENLLRRMDFIRKLGNTAAHAGKKITREQAVLCLENLYIFLDFVAYCNGENYEERAFDRSTLSVTSVRTGDSSPRGGAESLASSTGGAESLASPSGGGVNAAGGADGEGMDLAALIAKNAALREELTRRREEQQPGYGIELAYLAGKKYSRARHDLIAKVAAVASVANIPEIMAEAELIKSWNTSSTTA